MSGPLPRCVQADATDERGYAEALGGERADVLLSDPPYCLLTRRRKGGDLREDRGRKIDHEIVVRYDTVRDYRRFTEAWLPKAVAHCKPGAPLVLWTNFLGKEPILQVARSLGYGHLAGEFVWGKRTTEKSGNEYMLRVYEVALVLLREPPPPPSPADPPQVWSVVSGYDDAAEGDRWGDHPHQKPLSVVEPLVRAYSRPGDLVLDPFAGSGSIPAAALRLGRRTACLELVPGWARDVSRRLQDEAARPR